MPKPKKLKKLSVKITEGVNVDYSENKVAVKPMDNDKSSSAKWGLMRTLIKEYLKINLYLSPIRT